MSMYSSCLRSAYLLGLPSPSRPFANRCRFVPRCPPPERVSFRARAVAPMWAYPTPRVTQTVLYHCLVLRSKIREYIGLLQPFVDHGVTIVRSRRSPRSELRSPEFRSAVE